MRTNNAPDLREAESDFSGRISLLDAGTFQKKNMGAGISAVVVIQFLEKRCNRLAPVFIEMSGVEFLEKTRAF